MDEYSSVKWGVHSGEVGWGNALQAESSRFGFPMASLGIFIELINPSALQALGRLSL